MQNVQKDLRDPHHVGVEVNRQRRQDDGEFVAHLLDERAAGVHSVLHDRRQLDSLPAEFQFATRNAGHIQQVFHEPGHLRHLPLHNVTGLLYQPAVSICLPNQLHGIS